MRQANKNDFAALQAIKPELDEKSFLENLRQQEQGQLDWLVAEDNREAVAYVQLKWRGKTTHPDYPDLVDLYTKESARGKGYATQLIQECERLVKERGFTKIGMAANIDPDCPARKLYAKLGYVHDGKEQYVDGVYNGVEDWVIDLEKHL